MKIVIFGSEGTIGKDLFKFIGKENKLIRIDNIKKKKVLKINLANKLKKIIKLDTDEKTVAIILAFYKTQPKEFNSCNPKIFFEKNKNILNNCIKIIKKNRINNVIYFSSAAIYKNNISKKKINEKFKIMPENIYSKFKLYAEKKIQKTFKKNNYRVLILRLFNIFNDKGNPLIKFFKSQLSKNKNIVISGNGHQKRDFLHTKDISFLIKKISYTKLNKFEIFNLSSSYSVSINQILRKLKIPKKKIIYDTLSRTNYNLVGDSRKLIKRFNWRITEKFL